jgi:hypothetical protein
LLDLAFQVAVPQPFWQNVPHLGEDWRNFLLHLATDNNDVVGDINHGTMPAYFSAFDFPHKDNFLSYLHNLLLYFWSQNKFAFGRASGLRGLFGGSYRDQSLRVNTALKKGENETADVGWINMLKKGHYELT